MEKNLPVLYKSQWDQDARMTANDCGPASIAMVLNYYGHPVTTDEVYARTGAGNGIINFPQMFKAISSYGFEYQHTKNSTPEQLKKYIDQGLPVIALVRYGSLKSVQNTNYKSGHFFTVVGYRNDGYFVNDPNFWGNSRSNGDHHFYSKEEFEQAWLRDNSLDQNPNGSLIVISPKTQKPILETPSSIIPHRRNVSVVAEKGINIRTTPTTATRNISRILSKGKSFSVEGYLIGESVLGNNLWWKLVDKNEYAWSGATDIVPSVVGKKSVDEGLSINEQSDNIFQLKKKLEEMNSLATKYKNGLDEANRKLAEYDNQNFDTVKTANQMLSEEKRILMDKMQEIKNQRDNSYIQAFEGWNLLEIPEGIKGTVAVLSAITKLSMFSNNKHYVLGWKEGAKIHQSSEQDPVEASTVSPEALQNG